MKLADIPRGSDLAYRCAAKLIAEQVEFELETCRQLFGTEPERVLDLLAKTPDWAVFFEDDEEGSKRPASPLNQSPTPPQFQSKPPPGRSAMTCVVCGHLIKEGYREGRPPRQAKYCLECRAERRRRAKLKYTWQPEYDAYLEANYFGGVKRRFRVLSQMVRMTGLPRWYIKRQAARLGLTMHMDRRPWTSTELNLLEKLVGRVSTGTIAKRLRRSESSVVKRLKRTGTSRRVRDGYTMRDLELCLGEDHHKISGWIANGWLQDRLQGTQRHGGNGNDIHRIREQDIVAFIKNHPQEINLRKVDQTWFLDLVLLKGREVPEAKSPRRVGAEEEDAAA